MYILWIKTTWGGILPEVFGHLISIEEYKMQPGFMLRGCLRLWWAIAHHRILLIGIDT